MATTLMIAQTTLLHGDVFTCENLPLHGAIVREVNSGKFTSTDTRGHFEMSLNHVKTVVLEVRYLGFQTVIDTLKNTDTYPIFRLHYAQDELQTVEIVGHPEHSDLHLTQTYIESAQLEKNRRGTLMQSLEKIPGISGIQLGTGISKPVIRGFTANRVLVNQAGIKQEGQQWGYDHGLEIDAFAVERMRIIKGAATLRYGPDATAGVLDLLPIAPGTPNTFSAQAETGYQSNNKGISTSISAQINRNSWFLKLRTTAREYGDYQVPGDSFVYNTYRLPLYNGYLRNTSGTERNVHADGGSVRKWGVIRAGYSDYQLEAGMFPGAFGVPRAYQIAPDGNARNIDLPKQNVRHKKAYIGADIYLNRNKITVNTGYQQNRRIESSEPHVHGRSATSGTEALNLLLQTAQFNAHFSSNPTLKLHFETGIDLQWQENIAKGFEFLIPSYQREQGGLYGILHLRASEHIELNAGLRSDALRMVPQKYALSLPSGSDWKSQQIIPQAYDAADWAASAGMRITGKKLTHTLSIARTFRFPNVSELYSNGVHHGTFRHEQGSSLLPVETGWQADAATVLHRKFWQGTLSTFSNYFSPYLYLKPTSSFSPLPEAGQLFVYSADPAFFAGGELEISVRPVKHLSADFHTEYVYNQNLNSGLPLPFTPPLKVGSGLQWEMDLKKWKGIYFGGDFSYTFAQNRTDRNEAQTSGYYLMTLRAGATFSGKYTAPRLFIEIQNVFNTPYLNHLSRYRLINLPEQGRNIAVGISIPVSINLRH
jgi:iron complex outermembrane receptor protein